jgi:hypothetical protein
VAVLSIALLALLAGRGFTAGPLECCPPWLPRYEVTLDLDVASHVARVRMVATWTNPQQVPTQQLVFNAHSRFVLPEKEVGVSAKTLELLRLDPSTGLIRGSPPLTVQQVYLVDGDGQAPAGPLWLPLKFHYEGDTATSLVVPLPREVGCGQSVTVVLDFTLQIPAKQWRWGQWQGVTTLSNWLPVFAYYGYPHVHQKACAGPPPVPPCCSWQPTPFVPWHQPFYNEAGHYRVRATLAADQQVACTGNVIARCKLPDGRQQLDIEAPAVRDFAFLCSSRYRVFEGFVPLPGAPAGVRLRILAFPEHEHYARAMLGIVSQAITTYSQWFGLYPWPEFTIAESFFGWNGNECGTLVMIDERVFALPHLAGKFVDALVTHEVCHQWWYNQVGTNGYCETWMDEGFATYFCHRLLDQKGGKNDNLMSYPLGLSWLPNVQRETYRCYGMYGTLGRGDNGPVIRPMSEFGHVVNLFSMTYDKGSRIVGMIEARLGPVAFLDFMHCLFRRYRFRILHVADFQHELETYTGRSWEEFFERWLYGPGLTDWAVEKVHVQRAPKCAVSPSTQVSVILHQKAALDEPTTLGIALDDGGYCVRIPLVPQAQPYDCAELSAHVEPLGNSRFHVDVSLPRDPVQIAVDPDQILVDCNPANNCWKPPVRVRFAPCYTFLEESDLANPYDRWSFIFGPWIYGTAYYDAWYTRTMATMIGFRAALYRMQNFCGGVYGGYRTDYRDVLVGVDGLFDHWPGSHFQAGYDFEQRIVQLSPGQNDAKRAVLFLRYIVSYGSSLYLPNMEFMESFVTYQDNFLPFAANPEIHGERFTSTTTAGFHYRKDYLTPYWNPLGGFRFDVWYEGGMANRPETVGMQKLSSQLSYVDTLPNLSTVAAGMPWLAAPLEWLACSRVALRAYAGTSMPGRGEFFSMGGSYYFRAFDLAQRQGSSLWIGSVEWRLPVASNLHLDACDHILRLQNIDLVPFYDVGNVYVSGHAVGPTAQGVGASLRFDVSWFSFVERTLLRFDVAQALHLNIGPQFWFGVGVPF